MQELEWHWGGGLRSIMPWAQPRQPCRGHTIERVTQCGFPLGYLEVSSLGDMCQSGVFSPQSLLPPGRAGTALHLVSRDTELRELVVTLAQKLLPSLTFRVLIRLTRELGNIRYNFSRGRILPHQVWQLVQEFKTTSCDASLAILTESMGLWTSLENSVGLVS